MILLIMIVAVPKAASNPVSVSVGAGHRTCHMSVCMVEENKSVGWARVGWGWERCLVAEAVCGRKV